MVSQSNFVSTGLWPQRMMRLLLSQSARSLPVSAVPYMRLVDWVMQAVE